MNNFEKPTEVRLSRVLYVISLQFNGLIIQFLHFIVYYLQ